MIGDAMQSDAVFAALDNMSGVAVPLEAGTGQQRGLGLGDAEAVRYGFRIGSLNLLVMDGVPSEIVERPAISHLPNTPAWFVGLCNVRGNLVPVYDLALHLGVAVSQPNRPIIVIDRGSPAVAVPLSHLPEVHTMRNVQPVAYQPKLNPHLAGAIRGSCMIADECWLIFDHRSYFGCLVAADEYHQEAQLEAR